MGVVLADDFAHYRSGLPVRLFSSEPNVVHRIENPAVDRLQAVPHVRQRPAHYDAHRVEQERPAHLVFYVDRDYLSVSKLGQTTTPQSIKQTIKRSDI
ncbi:MAG: hypothetical protein BWY92_01398 [Firmicutes bacterium ADurb.BinA052]|nr:MAG: hypothetical protein BWY92_01398 [Firmicutes bacterium ADurb.BinA052]